MTVDNMSCAACPYMVRETLAAVDGVRSVTVSYKAKTATVVYDDRRTSVTNLAAATFDAGYPSYPVRQE